MEKRLSVFLYPNLIILWTLRIMYLDKHVCRVSSNTGYFKYHQV